MFTNELAKALLEDVSNNLDQSIMYYFKSFGTVPQESVETWLEIERTLASL